MTDTRQDPAAHLVLCTCPNRDVAAQLAEDLVAHGLAACVNILPGLLSVYRWQGRVERDEEVLLIAKTVAARLASLTARVAEQHPYDVPEVIALPVVAGHHPYLDWIRQCTATQA